MADRMSSQEFRTRYPHLTEPVVVTARGRPIGTWYPIGAGPEDVHQANLASRAYLIASLRQAFGLPPR